MPWSHGKDQKKENEQSLTTVLETPELRGDLTLLLASCTESMRKTLADAFEVQLASPQKTDTNPENRNDKDQKSEAEADPAKAVADAAERQRKERDKLEKELSAPKTQELKLAALEFFEQWREMVLHRVGEAVNATDAAQAQKKEARAQAEPERKTQERELEPEDGDEPAASVLSQLYPPQETPLAQLPREKRILILHSLLLLLLGLEAYLSHSRVLLLHVTSSLKLDLKLLTEDEEKIAKGLLEAASEMSADDETKKKVDQNATSRKWKVGIASVAGAAVIGLTGGLAAPLVAAGIGTVMGGLGLGATAAAGYLGALASSGVLVGGLFGAYGGRMTGQMMDQYAKEVEDFGFMPLHQDKKPKDSEKEFRRLRIAIGISGWLTNKEEVVEPWRVLDASIEGFGLRYELETMLNLGNGLVGMAKSAAWNVAKSEVIKHTVFASLAAALWPISLLKISRVVDNPFSVAKSRSDKAGQVLADALINKAQGERPVTLIGYSLGARVIYSCLQSLADRKAFGLVESVVLLGAPTPSTAPEWRRMRAVVSGRLVNVYSVNDYILAFLYRTSSVQYGIAGLQKAECVKGIENVDVSDMVSGHTAYRYLTGRILRKIGFEDVNLAEVEREEREMKEAEAKDAKEKEKKKGKNEDAEKEAAEIEEKARQKSKIGKVEHATEKMKLGEGKSAKGADAPAK
ncbi:hypothetical protein IWX90DRAFT_381749 [Phyllosticta citrichinensis]|uniref:DUF726-domain-containing protein n=1 Tax=Phyllosticta citrichinensis TaxID=1130410 RepID=A0ABR1Y1I6_9PEZI